MPGVSRLPEGIPVGGGPNRSPVLLVQLPDPFGGGAALGEPGLEAEPLGEGGEHLVVVAGLADRVDQPRHPEQVVVRGAAADVLPLERGGHRQDHVRPAGERVPERLVDDHRLRRPPGTGEPVQVLMVVERVAAGPVHEPDVRVPVDRAVVGEGRTGMEQHVGDPGHRDERVDRVRGAADAGEPDAGDAVPDGADRPVSEAESPTGQSDLAEGGGEGDHRPVGLLAVVGPLQRPGRVHHRPVRCHVARHRSTIRPASTPVIDAAHPGSRTTPSSRPST